VYVCERAGICRWTEYAGENHYGCSGWTIAHFLAHATICFEMVDTLNCSTLNYRHMYVHACACMGMHITSLASLP